MAQRRVSWRAREAGLLLLVCWALDCQLVGGIEQRTLAVCIGGAQRCNASAHELCAADGASWGSSPCDPTRPLCAADGACVQCTEADGTVLADPTPGDCLSMACAAGLRTAAPDDSDVEAEPKGNCQRAFCSGGVRVQVADDTNHVDDGDRCTNDRCVAGELVVTPAVAAGAPCQLAVGRGVYYTCARAGDGKARCWGANDRGQLGLGAADLTKHSRPQTLPGLPPAKTLAVGSTHACALLRDGALRCWGDDGYGQSSGKAPGPDVPAPTPVALPQPALDVAAGAGVTCAILDDATVRCWGRNDTAQLGDGTTTDRPTPTQVLDPTRPSGVLDGVVALALSDFVTCALLDDASVKCWGQPPNVGDGTSRADGPPLAPVTVYSNVAQLSASSDHHCARTLDGRVACWGWNAAGECGDAASLGGTTLVPTLVPGLADVTEVGAGWRHSCAAVPSGVVCWGLNSEGALGNASGCVDASAPGCQNAYSLVPVHAKGIGAVTDLAVVWAHTCAIEGGGMRCWGDNAGGQLGDGTTDNADAPVKVLW